jgi:SPP1 family predicted phage head-tail adaptor
MVALGWQLKKKRIITGPSPSEFNARITLEYPSKVPDGAGGYTATWVIAGTVWAIVNSYQSDEMTVAMQTTGITIRKIRIRYRPDLKNNWRIGYMGKYLNLVGDPIDVNESHRWLDLRVKG